MKHIAAALLLTLAGSAGAAQADDQLARAEEIVAGRCFLCHGMEGESSSHLFPRLSGQHADYVVKQLRDFKAGKRKSDTMNTQAADLTDEDMKALGRYYQSKSAQPHPPADAELMQVGRFIYQRGNQFSGVAACVGCHGPKAQGAPQLPRLAGQQALYVENQLKSFNKRERTNDNDVMHTVAAKLTELEMKAVAEFVSSLD